MREAAYTPTAGMLRAMQAPSVPAADPEDLARAQRRGLLDLRYELTAFGREVVRREHMRLQEISAAALLGIESIPAQVIVADTSEQAAAFKSINGQVTRMHNLALHHAALAAGDAAARAVQEVCDAAGVKILRYPKQASRLEPGETMALGTIAEGLRQFERETVITALQCVVETSNNRPGLVAAQILRALFQVLGGNTAWRDAGEALLTAFDRIDLEAELKEASFTRRPEGVATWEVLAGRLCQKLAGALAEAAA